MTEMTVATRPFVRASEVWVPAGGGRLHLASGAYGALDAFAEVSGETSFGRGEGLPGKAWDRGRPVILTGFRGSYFKRTEAAEAAGLTAAIALPVFAGDALKGVLVLFFGDDTQSVGAVEVWTVQDGTPVCIDSIGGGTHDATAVFRAAAEGVPQAIARPGGARVAIPVHGARGVTHVAAWSL